MDAEMTERDTSIIVEVINDSTSSNSAFHVAEGFNEATRVRLKARRSASGSCDTPPPPLVRTPDRLSQLRQEEYVATFREQSHEREFSSALSLSRSWDNLSLSNTFEDDSSTSCNEDADKKVVFGASYRRKRCSSLSSSEPLYIHVTSSSCSSASQSPVTLGGGIAIGNGMRHQKQCFSPSLQAPVSPAMSAVLSSAAKRRRTDSGDLPARKRLSVLVSCESQLTMFNCGSSQPSTPGSSSISGAITTEEEDVDSLFKSPS